ncbi:MAG: cytochrome c oxidase assembly protein [Gemmatimonadota bacterium]|nr:cytochrome c oxidase assembly protein [Gemmatimonadota bacterium]
MNWWCSAQGLPWTWKWQPYPGVWLFVGVIALLYWKLGRGSEDSSDSYAQSRPKFFLVGLLLLWAAIDWPIGPLGAGYLASVHQLQFVLLVVWAPPFLIIGVAPDAWRRLVFAPLVKPLAQFVTKPLVAFGIYNFLVIGTHFPDLVDGLMVSQLGSFGFDLLWIAAGFGLWWPVISPVPEMNGLSYPQRFGYMFGSVILAAAPALFLIYSKYPLYELYELAPPVTMMPAKSDQLLGGLIMKIGSTVAVVTATTIIFFRWHRAEAHGDTEREMKLPTLS